MPASMSGVNSTTAAALTVVAGYLLGSIPFANLIARRHAGTDLRTVGDRNPGYWNAKEVLGRRAALSVFVLDAVKGGVAAGVGMVLVGDLAWRHGTGWAGDSWAGSGWAGDGAWGGYLGAAAAMVGHAWPAFAGFRGGRSVLTFAGAACVLSPITTAVAIAVLVVVAVATRSFAWGARCAVFAFPVVQLFVDGPYRTAATGALMSIIGARFAMASRQSRAHP